MVRVAIQIINRIVKMWVSLLHAVRNLEGEHVCLAGPRVCSVNSSGFCTERINRITSVIMEAEKYCDRLSVSQIPQDAGSVTYSQSEGLRTRGVDGVTLRQGQRPENPEATGVNAGVQRLESLESLSNNRRGRV